MKASEWIHKRGMQTFARFSGNERMLDADPAVLRSTLMAVIDYLDQVDGPFDEEAIAPADDGPVGPIGPAPTAPGANGPSEPSVPELVNLDYYRRLARDIWGPPELTITDIVVRLGVDYGKLARLARGATKDSRDPAELEAAFGNIIFSMIRWADDLGLDLGRCMALAIKTQQKFARENSAR